MKNKQKIIETRRASSAFDYPTAGGKYVPTREQNSFCITSAEAFKTQEEKQAARNIIQAFASKQRISHDFIHIVNEVIRNNKINNSNF